MVPIYVVTRDGQEASRDELGRTNSYTNEDEAAHAAKALRESTGQDYGYRLFV